MSSKSLFITKNMQSIDDYDFIVYCLFGLNSCVIFGLLFMQSQIQAGMFRYYSIDGISAHVDSTGFQCTAFIFGGVVQAWILLMLPSTGNFLATLSLLIWYINVIVKAVIWRKRATDVTVSVLQLHVEDIAITDVIANVFGGMYFFCRYFQLHRLLSEKSGMPYVKSYMFGTYSLGYSLFVLLFTPFAFPLTLYPEGFAELYLVLSEFVFLLVVGELFVVGLRASKSPNYKTWKLCLFELRYPMFSKLIDSFFVKNEGVLKNDEDVKKFKLVTDDEARAIRNKHTVNYERWRDKRAPIINLPFKLGVHFLRVFFLGVTFFVPARCIIGYILQYDTPGDVRYPLLLCTGGAIVGKLIALAFSNFDHQVSLPSLFINAIMALVHAIVLTIWSSIDTADEGGLKAVAFFIGFSTYPMFAASITATCDDFTSNEYVQRFLNLVHLLCFLLGVFVSDIAIQGYTNYGVTDYPGVLSFFKGSAWILSVLNWVSIANV